MKNKRFLITGSAGQLGEEFKEILAKRNLQFDAPPETECDITNFAQLKEVINQIKPDCIINCGAYNNVDEAEENPEPAYLVNSKAVENLTQLCKKGNIFLVHYSSDYVFDGKKGDLYTEDDIPNPLNVYGKSKFKGENIIRDYLTDYLIFRTSWVIGRGKQNFLYKLMNWAKENRVLKISADETSVPTYTEDIVNATLLSLEKELKGLYHLTNSGYASRYELAKYFIDKMGLDNIVIPVCASSFSARATRPLFSAMSNKRISKKLNISISHWEKGIDRFIGILKKQEVL